MIPLIIEKLDICGLYRNIEIFDCLEYFCNESAYGWTFNLKNAIEEMELYCLSDEAGVFIIKADDNIAGFAFAALDSSFHSEIIGYISKFFIMPNYRRTKAGRMLSEYIILWFDDMGCAHSFATSTANIGQDKLFVNLFAKKGYSKCGFSLVRGKK